jgi:hypothetical protein
VIPGAPGPAANNYADLDVGVLENMAVQREAQASHDRSVAQEEASTLAGEGHGP